MPRLAELANPTRFLAFSGRIQPRLAGLAAALFAIGLYLALFVAPVLVMGSYFLGPHPMALVFNGFEIAGVLLAILVATHITNDGESTWFEGLQLLAVYVVLGATFFAAGSG